MSLLHSPIFLLTVAACSASAVSRIEGGEPTTIEKYPYIAQVDNWYEGSFWAQSSGGSILTTRYILSAAHAFLNPSNSPLERRIRAGSSYRNTGGIVRYIAHVMHHPTYGLNDYDGDICLVLLSTPLIYSNVIVQATIVPQGFVLPDNLPVIQTGWGMEYIDGVSSDVLREVEVFTINNDLCRERYEVSTPSFALTRNMICAGLLDVGGKGICYGDSGSPLVYDNIVVGFVSGGVGCANGTTPGVNTAVSSYTNWIIENVN